MKPRYPKPTRRYRVKRWARARKHWLQAAALVAAFVLVGLFGCTCAQAAEVRVEEVDGVLHLVIEDENGVFVTPLATILASKSKREADGRCTDALSMEACDAKGRLPAPGEFPWMD